ncbi:MAG: 7-carboxy-7-deazaguanine synthase [Parvularculales bacterium]
MYSVKEIFYTLQGEGYYAGRPAILCRFAGCNLWSGREDDRTKAICSFCDTDFIGIDGLNGGRFATAEELATAVERIWPVEEPSPYVVCTGGEPSLQLDEAVIESFHARGFTVAIETNGTHPLPQGIDWICVSPKANTTLSITKGHELKLIFPQVEPQAHPECFEHLEFEHFYLQPMDSSAKVENSRQATAYCLNHSQWKLSVQLHKLMGIS